MKTWLTVAESAEYAGVSRDTIYTACERGELHHARIGGRRSIASRRNGSMPGSSGTSAAPNMRDLESSARWKPLHRKQHKETQ